MLFNAVKKGGVTYAKYLIPISNSLKKAGLNYLVINIPDHCEIDNETLECMLEHSVLSMTMIEVPSLECDVVISNDAYLGRLLDDSIEAIFISHGATPMPVSDSFYFSGWTAYWDGVIVSSLTSINLFCTGLRKYRQFRKQLKIPTPQDALRSDLRSTNIYHINPIKIPSLFDLEYSDSESFLKDKVVVGILPSSLNVAGNNTLYRYMVDILSAIFFILPKAFIILRPYPLDVNNPMVAKVVAQINDKVQVDDSSSASDLFYSKCHLIITDVSSGGVTFMLRRGCPAIYYLPAIGNSSIEQQWLKEMQDYLLVATSAETLKSQIAKATEMFGDPIRSVAKNFAYKEYGGKHIDQFVESFINSRQNQSIFQSCAAKSINSSGCVIDLET